MNKESPTKKAVTEYVKFYGIVVSDPRELQHMQVEIESARLRAFKDDDSKGKHDWPWDAEMTRYIGFHFYK